MVTKIIVNEKDITEDFIKYFTDIQIIDKDGIASDELNFTLTYAIKRPKYQDKIKIWIGGVFYGTFLVQTTTTNHLNELIIRATGTNFSSQIKSKKNRSFSKTTLQDIVTTIAKENNLNYKVDFNEILIENIIQSKESDLHFLTRMAKKHDAIFSIKNNTIIFLKRSSTLPTVNIDLNKCASWSISHSDKRVYASALAKWRDTKENKMQETKVNEGTPILEFEGTFSSDVEAKREAEAKLQRANRGTKDGYLLLKGVYISAGSKINIIGSKQDDGIYTATTVTTTISISTGWITEIDFNN